MVLSRFYVLLDFDTLDLSTSVILFMYAHQGLHRTSLHILALFRTWFRTIWICLVRFTIETFWNWYCRVFWECNQSKSPSYTNFTLVSISPNFSQTKIRKSSLGVCTINYSQKKEISKNFSHTFSNKFSSKFYQIHIKIYSKKFLVFSLEMFTYVDVIYILVSHQTRSE